MPTVEIITGGAGSGKTREIVSRLAALYRADPFAGALVLVPTIRHADQFRRRLVQECGVAMNLRVETLSMLSRSLSAGAPILSGSRATDELARVARRTVARGGAASYFSPIAGSAGFVTMIASAVAGLLEEETNPDELQEAAAQTGSEPAQALTEIYSAYLSELRQMGLTHPLQVNRVAAEAIQAGAPTPNVVMLDGFQRFTAGELRLITALSQRAEMTIGFDRAATERSKSDYERLEQALPGVTVKPLLAVDVGSVRKTKGEAANQEQHAREIARQIKQLMADDPTLRPSDCAVTFRQVTPYLAMMRRIFEEYEIPLDPAAGARLSDTPVGSWLRRLLGVAENGWRVKDVAAVLRSGVVNLERWGLTTDVVDGLSQQARENKIWSGREALKGLAGEDGAGLAAALKDIGGLLEGLESDAAGRERRLMNALFGEQGWLKDAHNLDEETAQSVEQLRAYLTEMAESSRDADADEPETIDRFSERLNRRLAMPVLMRRTPGGVLLAPMHTMHGLRFRHVAVGGLSEGEFPAGRRSGELLNDAMRESLKDAGLQLPLAPRSTEEELWQSVTSRADGSTALWRYRINDGGKPVPAAWAFEEAEVDAAPDSEKPEPPQPASHRELAIACSLEWKSGFALRPPLAVVPETDSWNTIRVAARMEQIRRSFHFAGAFEGQVSKGLAPWMTREGSGWSASSLDSYLTCSFQYFGRYVLRLKELDDEPEEGDGAMRGSIIHAILEKAFEPLVEQGLPLSVETIGQVTDHIDSHGREMWMNAPEKEGFGQAALWRLEWQRYRDRMIRMLEQEMLVADSDEGYRVFGTEYEFEETVGTKPPLRIRGKIDRIDETPDGLTVIDYKTGKIPTQKDVREGKNSQLPLYALALRNHPDAKGKNLRAEYAKLPSRGDRKHWELNDAIPEDAWIIKNVLGTLQEKRDAVESGDFRVKPTPTECPSYCAMKHVCRVNAFSRHKS